MTRKTKKQQASSRSTSKTRFELRFDSALYEKLRSLCDTIDISINQFMAGLTSYAVSHAVPGLPTSDHDHFVNAVPCSNCVFFGKVGEPENESRGHVDFVLDFRPERAVRSLMDYTDCDGMCINP